MGLAPHFTNSNGPLANDGASHPLNYVLYWLRGLSSQRKSVFSGDIKPEAEMATWTFWASYATEPTSKKIRVIYYMSWCD